MSVIVVANPKGGVGKSTLSTNLAGYFAAAGEWVALADLDKQHSAHAWLELRPATLPAIETWEVNPDTPVKPRRSNSLACSCRISLVRIGYSAVVVASLNSR